MSPVSSRTIRRSSPATTSGFSVDAVGELGIQQRRAQVGEQAERLADPEQALLGPQRARQRVVVRAADGAHQHRVGALRERERRVRQRLAGGVVAGAADRRGLGLDGAGRRARSASSSATASRTISGPMPSPGRMAIFTVRLSRREHYAAASARCAAPADEPGLVGEALRLERADLVGVLQREPDVVEAVQQAVLAERLDLEA